MIGYLVRLLSVPLGYYGAAALILLAVGWATRKWNAGLLAAYLFVLLASTVLARWHRAGMRYQLEVFWSYRVWGWQAKQIIANILAYAPVGLLAASLMGWPGIFLGTGCSVLLELLQLVLHRGLFEFDDIINNTLGAIVGVLIYKGLTALIRKYHASGGK